MGRKSTKENKNIYQISRENANLTREAAADNMATLSADRIEKIENERLLPHPEDILEMAECYHDPALCNYYCAEVCALGEGRVKVPDSKVLSQITLEMLASLNAMDKQKNRLIEIAADGRITEDEYQDFAIVRHQLDKISGSISALQLWMDQMIVDGKIDKTKLEREMAKLNG